MTTCQCWGCSWDRELPNLFLSFLCSAGLPVGYSISYEVTKHLMALFQMDFHYGPHGRTRYTGGALKSPSAFFCPFLQIPFTSPVVNIRESQPRSLYPLNLDPFHRKRPPLKKKYHRKEIFGPEEIFVRLHPNPKQFL